MLNDQKDAIEYKPKRNLGKKLAALAGTSVLLYMAGDAVHNIYKNAANPSHSYTDTFKPYSVKNWVEFQPGDIKTGAYTLWDIVDTEGKGIANKSEIIEIIEEKNNMNASQIGKFPTILVPEELVNKKYVGRIVHKSDQKQNGN
jgi:hypothetical protein